MHRFELLQWSSELAKPYTKTGEAYYLQTEHDDWCPLRDGQGWSCLCKPTITLFHINKRGKLHRPIRLVTEGKQVTPAN